jgi:hypothetical protein
LYVAGYSLCCTRLMNQSSRRFCRKATKTFDRLLLFLGLPYGSMEQPCLNQNDASSKGIYPPQLTNFPDRNLHNRFH